MSISCSVKSCRNNNNLPISFFKVPSRLSKQWRLVLDRGMRWTPKPNSKICMVHFRSDQYNKRGLLRGVEPNLHPIPLPDFTDFGLDRDEPEKETELLQEFGSIIEVTYDKVTNTFGSLKDVSLEEDSNLFENYPDVSHFKPASEISEDMAVKNGQPNKFPCDRCNFSATRSNDLKRHKESIHEGVRYKCDQCSFSASRPSLLRKHLSKSHPREISLKPFSCNLCRNSYETSAQLTEHKKTSHLNKNTSSEVENKTMSVQHLCDKCEYSAPSPLFLTNHRKSVHGIYPMKYRIVVYPCENCDYSPTTKEQLIKHKMHCKDELPMLDIKSEKEEDPLAGL